MTNFFAIGMRKAILLTKAGKPGEATALIQTLLNRSVPDATIEPDQTPDDHTVIEGAYQRLNDHHPSEPAKTSPFQPHGKRPGLRPSLRETLRRNAAGGMPHHRNRHGGQMAMRRNIGAVGAGPMAIFLVKHLITRDFPLRIVLFERHALAGTGNSSPNGRFWPLLTALRGRRNS